MIGRIKAFRPNFVSPHNFPSFCLILCERAFSLTSTDTYFIVVITKKKVCWWCCCWRRIRLSDWMKNFPTRKNNHNKFLTTTQFWNYITMNKLVASSASRAVLSKKSAPLISASFKFNSVQSQTRFIQTLRKKNNPGFFDVVSGIVSKH